MSVPRNQLVYDLPTRVFHWLFAGSFITAFTIANTAEHSAAFQYHMLAGFLLAALVVFRLIWGIVGTRHARFASFALRPGQLAAYFRAMFSGGGEKFAGHNPASSWSALLMLALGAGLGITGLLMVNGDREAYEDLHELLANAFLVTVLLHVAGVVLHVLRHRDGFARSMVDGRKQAVDGVAIGNSRRVVGFALLAAVAAMGVHLWRGYDPASGELQAFGTSVTLAESEPEAAGEHGDREHDEGDEH